MSTHFKTLLASTLLAALPSLSSAEIGASLSVGGGNVAGANVSVGGGSVAGGSATVGGGSVANVDATVGGGSVAGANATVGGGNVADVNATIGGGSTADANVRIGSGAASGGVSIGGSANQGGAGTGTDMVGMPLIASNGERLGQITSVSADTVCSNPYHSNVRNVCVRLTSTPTVTRNGLRVRIDPSVYRSSAQ